MLQQLSISHYAIVEQLEWELQHGMTVMTGATGAGKSILFDALALALGERADSQCIRPGAERAEIRACFTISHCPAAQQWLAARDLATDDDCLLRRVITQEGRSRGYINGTPVPLSDLKALGDYLVAMHRQHAHQALLKKSNHRRLLDDYASSQALAADVARIATAYQQVKQEHQQRLACQQAQAERRQLLTFQLHELEQLQLSDNEVEQLERQHQQLQQAQSTLSACQQIQTICADCCGDSEPSSPVLPQLATCLQALTNLTAIHPPLTNALDMLTSARIQITEAVSDISHFVDHFDADPQRLQAIEERLSAIYELARKHRIQPQELSAKQHSLQAELATLHAHAEHDNRLQARLDDLHRQYCEQASALRQKRQQAALALAPQINARLKLLGMPQGEFQVALTPLPHTNPQTHGSETVEFLVTTNPGHPLRPLQKIASGGELSRISLAIQVVTAQTSPTPTLLFDEVDVGIGGGIAEQVGKMLRELSEQGQVLCVTHQPQVAAQGHHHWQVHKTVTQATTQVQLTALTGHDRIQELARMLGGATVTAATVAHARDLLASTCDYAASHQPAPVGRKRQPVPLACKPGVLIHDR